MFAPLLFLYVALFERELSLRELMRPRSLAVVLRVTWPAFLVCFGMVATGMRLATTYTPGGSSRWHYLLTQPSVILHYVVSLFLPLQLSADTQWPLVVDPLDGELIAGAAFVAAALALAWVTSRRKATRPVAFGILWFFVALLPTSSVVPLAEPMNDHRMFFRSLASSSPSCGPRAGRRGDCRRTQPLAAGLSRARRDGLQHRGATRSGAPKSRWLDADQEPRQRPGADELRRHPDEQRQPAVADDYFSRALRSRRDTYLQVNLAVLRAAGTTGGGGAAFSRANKTMRTASQLHVLRALV